MALDRDFEYTYSAEIISSFWVNFATRGDPNGKDLPQWKPYDVKAGERAMVLGDKVEMGAARLEKSKIDLLDALSAKQR